MRISLDIDGVLANFSSVALDVLRDHFKLPIPADYIQTQWSFADVLGEVTWADVFEHMLREPQLWESIPPFEESVRAVHDYIAANGDEEIFYLTTRPNSSGGSAASSTQLWLMDQGLSFANLIVTQKTNEKRQFIIDNDIRCSLDDYTPTVTACQDIPGHRAYLMDRGYNQEAKLPRVFSVAEFLMEVEFGS